MAYVLKYPVKKVPGDQTSWVIRQAGVYHKHDSGLQTNTWLLVFPNRESFSAGQTIDAMSRENHPLGAHVALHFTHLPRWRWYMADFQKRFEEAVSATKGPPRAQAASS